MAEDNLTLRCALDYVGQWGWCVIPIPYRRKNARIRWKQFQTARPDCEQEQKWFGNGQASNMAVVLGPVSGNLCCRDFDVAESYTAWAKAHPDLAGLLPTVKTCKGYHVYFQADRDGIEHLGDGELRSRGGYCMLPPSVHPDGPAYEWIIPPTKVNLLVIDPEEAGFVPKNCNVTENTENTEENRGEQKRLRGGGDECHKAIDVNEKIHAAIDRTLPTEYGTRHRRVFDLARELKSMPEYTEAGPRVFAPVVLREWHRRAMPNINTKEFEETLIDFMKAWPSIKYSIGESPMAEIYDRAVRLDPPAVAIEKHPDHTKLIVLISLCRELQRAAGDGPFYLSCRTAARLLDVSPKHVSRWFFLLEDEDVLRVVVKGGTRENPRLATRFRYMPNLNN